MDTDDDVLNANESQKQSSDTKMFERIISRLKARFKSRICLQEIISQLSKLIDIFFNSEHYLENNFYILIKKIK